MTGPGRETMSSQDARTPWYRLADDAQEHQRRATRGLDTTVANAARVYGYLLGGKDNFQADRDAAEQVILHIPGSAAACRANRAFLARAVRHLAGKKGISQFIDIGCGLPTASNVHEIAQRTSPGARVVYADHDPVVATHARALLQEHSPGVLAVEADVRAPETITGNPDVRRLIDFSQPVALLMLAVLHFLPDADQPYEIVSYLKETLAPGSYLVLSHVTDEHVPPADSIRAQQVYEAASAPVSPRSRADVTRFFDALELTAPGVVDVRHWPRQSGSPNTPLTFYGGAARKPV
jgi:O-methyltransferase involved in polyketide biosynthesis